eukprot:CAMPEP_0116871740 /NCGR_PEP_ID=MMETSP0463-20121206/2220_1 /TAXON_ID=181622 /ORGANISM="Strombidinopsis sp, Strain SopsisLIS2011" /LENGTH=134 /DNA_ID=CAMNT_0004510723 /DNA_START=753 /DNA_END=1157 /DNA_ORIENTATION=+
MDGHKKKNTNTGSDSYKNGNDDAAPMNQDAGLYSSLKPKVEQFEPNPEIIKMRAEGLNLQYNKQQLYNNDQSPKAYLTSNPHQVSKHEYNTTTKFFDKDITPDKKHLEDIRSVHRTMKSTTYSIGRKGSPISEL